MVKIIFQQAALNKIRTDELFLSVQMLEAVSYWETQLTYSNGRSFSFTCSICSSESSLVDEEFLLGLLLFVLEFKYNLKI
jgi:hypothetical protein